MQVLFWIAVLAAMAVYLQPEKLGVDLVRSASQATVFKSIFTALAMVILLLLALGWAWRRWQSGSRVRKSGA